MCGIFGALNCASTPAQVEKMVRAMSHRGPDDSGVFFDEAVELVLGHVRLAIIDPTPAGHQPMSYCDGRYLISYNGEVYNYQELRAELESNGRLFVSGSDTEVVIAAFAEWGPHAVRRLRGMFAFAIWDRRERKLFLARDRFGIKPLYYFQNGSRFVFASELGSLLVSGSVPRRLDLQATWDYLSYGSAVQPRTLLRDVYALPPGCHATLASDSGEFVVNPYWDIASASQGAALGTGGMGYPEAVSTLRRQLEDATRAHLIADVPVGAFLSGGIDSTAVVGLMSRLTTHRIKTFSVGFERRHGELDELRWARIAAKRFGTDHHEVVVTEAMVRRTWDRLVAAIDQPSHDGTNTYFVSEASRQGGVTVALSGLGGDELFAGYPHFRRIQNAAAIARRGLPKMRKGLRAFGRFVPGRWRIPLQTLADTPAERVTSIRRWYTDAEKESIFSRAFLHGMSDCRDSRASISLPAGLTPAAEVTWAEVNGYLRDTLLRDVDAMSMAHSLEVRPVLLDHCLAETVFRLPDGYKVSHANSKRVFKDAVADLLPAGLLSRPKMGFELPLNAWLGGPLQPVAEDALASQAARRLFSADYLDSRRRSLGRMGRPYPETWAVVMLARWLERHGVDG